MSKYRAKPQVIDDHRFASKAEAARYSQLKVLAAAGKIIGLKLQPKFPIVINGVKVCTYIADFEYSEPLPTGELERVIEDVKGMLTPIYRLKKKLFETLYGLRIREIRK